ncbi:hypothetical protein DIPPA_07330 [Diplonema papillatum]|nr:hypothetical protein DIPPA_07330 [Diplonema papillatum]
MSDAWSSRLPPAELHSLRSLSSGLRGSSLSAKETRRAAGGDGSNNAAVVESSAGETVAGSGMCPGVCGGGVAFGDERSRSASSSAVADGADATSHARTHWATRLLVRVPQSAQKASAPPPRSPRRRVRP